MKKVIKLFTLTICTLLLFGTSSCKDMSLREPKKQIDEWGDDVDDVEDGIRVVTDVEAAITTPNCIMVKPGESATIPIAKAFAMWQEYNKLFDKKVWTKGTLDVEIFWAIPSGIIDVDDIEIEDYEDVNKATIHFKTEPESNGNALLVLMVGGEVRWSWHIWVTDYEPGHDHLPQNLSMGGNSVNGGELYRYKNFAGDNLFMDRNLGANSADPNQGEETHGMYYQWGKKDPLPGFAPPNSFTYPPDYYLKNNLAHSIEFPDEIIIGNDWYSYHRGTHNNDLWGAESGAKTPFDPCPEGWRVPLYGAYKEGVDNYQELFSPFYIIEPKNEFVYVGNNPNPNYRSPILGFFPGTGSIGSDGELNNGVRELQLWTASSSIIEYESGRSYPFRIINDKPSYFAWERGLAMNVRCVQEPRKR